VADPFALQEAPVRAFAGLAPLALLAPFALVGTLLAWVPYRLVGPLAERLARGHGDLVGTIKLLAGVVVLAPVYLAWAVLVGLWLGPLAGAAMLVVGPLTGRAALAFDERLALRRDVFHGLGLRMFAGRHARALEERRRELAGRVERLVGR
jgi:hypothetical protein